MQKITLEQPTKKDFTDAFNKLVPFGYDVKNFNNEKRIGTGGKGFVDHLITGHGHMVFVEVKLGRDTIKPKQKVFAEKVKEVVNKNNTVKYFCITQLTEALGIVDYLVEHQNCNF